MLSLWGTVVNCIVHEGDVWGYVNNALSLIMLCDLLKQQKGYMLSVLVDCLPMCSCAKLIILAVILLLMVQQ